MQRVAVLLAAAIVCALPTESGSTRSSGTPAAKAKPGLASCQMTIKHRRSRTVNNDQRAHVTFNNRAPFPVDLYWIGIDGKEQQREKLHPDMQAERYSWVGHVFRIRQHGSGTLMTEHVASNADGDREQVRIENCQQAAGYRPSGAFKPATPEVYERAVHDQNAPCEPEGKSAQWSCVRKVPPSQVALRPEGAYGFTLADDIDTNVECKLGGRKMGQTTDDGYSNKRHRLSIDRVTKGPGYLKMSIDPELWQMLHQWAFNHSALWKEQVVKSKSFEKAEAIGGCYSNTHNFPFSKLDLDHFQQVRAKIVAYMKGVLEWWTNMPLEHTSTYGMRLYHRQAMLLNHVDREDTHIASAVIQVLQDVDADGGWPLEVVGEDDVVREVYLQPGEMVLYEGARLLHGRPMRFNGTIFGNIFSHFKPDLYYQGSSGDAVEEVDEDDDL